MNEIEITKLSPEMQAMVEIVKQYDTDLWQHDTHKHYFSPDIPDKIVRKLIKNFDAGLPIKSLIAFYDLTVFNSSGNGLLFTNDGFYEKFMGKAHYFRYCDVIDSSTYMGTFHTLGLRVSLISADVSSYDIFEPSMNAETLKKILDNLIAIDAIYGQASMKQSGKVKKISLPPEKEKKCRAIIHSASAGAGAVGAGLAQIPASDSLIIVPIQIGMITSLGKVFDLNITESAAKSVLASATATISGRTASQFLFGWLPGIGNVINTATAAGITEAIGWLAVNNFYNRWIKDLDKGRFEGMKAGFSEACDIFLPKLKKDAEDFLTQKKDYEKEKEEYEELLNAYELYIGELKKERADTSEIEEMKDIYERLRELRTS